MNEPINDGGKAIETSGEKMDIKLWSLDSDISLRDWFAGQALSGVLANHQLLLVVDGKIKSESTRASASIYAYSIADAMLKAREQK